MDLKQLYREETGKEPYQDVEIENNFTRHYVNWLEQQFLIQRVSESKEIRDCHRCEFDYKIGICPKCDTDAYSR